MTAVHPTQKAAGPAQVEEPGGRPLDMDQENPTERHLKDLGKTADRYIEILANGRTKQLLLHELRQAQ